MYHLEIPFHDTAYKMADGRKHSSVNSTIVCVQTDEDIEGWGEICPWGTSYLPEFSAGARAAISLLAPYLVGSDPRNVAARYADMEQELPGHFYAKSALDIAMWDILGKTCNLPIHALLGGKLVGEVPLASAVFNGPVPEMLERINNRRLQGYQCFSTKPSGNLLDDIRLYQAIVEQEQPGEVYIADANKAWSLIDAQKLAPKLERLGLILEQPCSTYTECLKVRRSASIPMILDELIIDDDNLAAVARDDAADAVQLKVSRVGGLTAAKRMLDFCLVSGLSVVWATSGGCEISDAAVMHLAHTTPPQRLIATWSCREFSSDTFADGGPTIVNGQAFLNDSPGLGVQPDRHRLGSPIASWH